MLMSVKLYLPFMFLSTETVFQTIIAPMRSKCPAYHADAPHVGTVTAPHSACAAIPQAT